MPIKDINDLNSQADILLPDNSEQLITPADVRNAIKDINDSAINRLSDQSLLGLRTYDPTRSYVEGEGTFYDGVIYEALQGTSGVFNPDDWVARSSSSGTWGSIVGTISLQTDLMALLDAKQNAITANAPLYFAGNVLNVHKSSTSQHGYLSSTDWNTFNEKEDPITVSSPLIRTGNNIEVQYVNSSQDGVLSSDDYNTIIATPFIEIDYADILAAISGSALQKGKFYKILTGTRVNEGTGTTGDIIVQAITENSVAETGHLIVRLPQYGNIGSTIVDIWSSEATPSIDDRYIYNGKVFKNLTGENNEFSEPQSDPTNWELESINSSYYKTEIDKIEYYIPSDYIVGREDNRGNKVRFGRLQLFFSPNPIDYFQWGNDSNNSNSLTNSFIFNINSRCVYRNLFLSGGTVVPTVNAPMTFTSNNHLFNAVDGDILGSNNTLTGNLSEMTVAGNANFLGGTGGGAILDSGSIGNFKWGNIGNTEFINSNYNFFAGRSNGGTLTNANYNVGLGYITNMSITDCNYNFIAGTVYYGTGIAGNNNSLIGSFGGTSISGSNNQILTSNMDSFSMPTNADNNTFIGSCSSSSIAGSSNKVIGSMSGSGIPGGANYVIANLGGSTISGNNNRQFGDMGGSNLSGDNNFLLANLGVSTLSGNSNKFIGSVSLLNISGDSNCFYGDITSSGGGSLVQGSNNIVLGKVTITALATNGNIAIGETNGLNITSSYNHVAILNVQSAVTVDRSNVVYLPNEIVAVASGGFATYKADVLTANRTYLFPDADGTVALIDDINKGQNFRIVKSEGTATQNGNTLITAITEAQALTPNGAALSASNRAIVYVYVGSYNLGSSFIELSQYVDIIGIGDAKDIIITSSNTTGTIQIDNINNYILKNLTINNTGGGGSITHNASQTDSGKWNYLILGAKNTENTIFSGEYNFITGNSHNILNGNISGKVFKGTFQNYSCGASTTDSITISGSILDCTGGALCFGYADAEDVTISGTIQNCIAAGEGCGFSVSGTVTISGLIDNVTGITQGFGSTTATGKIKNCTRTAGYGIHLGTIESCSFSENDATNPALMVGDGAIVKYSTIYQEGAGDTISAGSAVTASLFHNAMNKAEHVNITNNIITPYNVVDSNISI